MSSKPIPRSAISWGDLLQFQALPAAEQSAAAAARLLGLPEVSLPERAVKTNDGRKQRLKKPDKAKKAVTNLRVPLRMPLGWVAVPDATPPKAPKALELPNWDAEEAAEVEAMLNPGGCPAPAPVTLLNLPQSMALCRQALAEVSHHGLDVDRTVSVLAQGTWPSPLPKSLYRRRLNTVHICVDNHPDRIFLINDYFALLTALRQSQPALQWQVHELDDLQAWRDLPGSLGPKGFANAPVLVLCEPNLLAPPERIRWQRLMREWRLAGTNVCLPLVWQEKIGLKAETMAPENLAASLQTLLACLSPAVTVEPALVRDIVAELGLRKYSLVLEHAVWTHDALDGALPWRQWLLARQMRCLSGLKDCPSDVQDRCWRVIERHHLYRHQVQRDQEMLNWVSACGGYCAERLNIADEFRDAQIRYFRVAQHLKHCHEGSEQGKPYAGHRAPVLSAAAHERLQTLPDCFRAHPEVAAMLAKVALNLPSAAEAEQNPAGMTSTSPRAALLGIRGQDLILTIQTQPELPGITLQFIDLGGDWLRVERDGGKSQVLALARLWQTDQAWPITDWRQGPAREIRISSAASVTRVLAHNRPPWAASFRQSSQGLQALLHWPDGKELWLDWPRHTTALADDHVQDWLLGFDQYGPRLIWQPMSFKPQFEALSAVRLRYLPPATFLMGSPEGVGQANEHPQHPVTLTQSLWLAETPCTQALWQAVMGNNPSHFRQGPEAPQRPVENVSWDDVQQFLAKLNTLLPEGCVAVLPTEAQWEYACRAGTTTDFWWGDEADDTRANFDTKGDRDWDSNEGTSPVNRYPPSPWGLYDMHGNVLEWCADDLRQYEQRATRDPVGGTAGDDRAVRGGSWFYHPGRARSACRDGGRPGRRFHSLGFRFALRSSSASGAEPQPGGQNVVEGSAQGGGAGGRTADKRKSS